jgi:protein-tyrosine-phosphatase
LDRPGAVLFACTLNAVRSPMAASLLAHLIGPAVRVASAGVRAGNPDPYVMAVMDEIGIDVCDHEPRSFRDLGDETFDLIITLSPEAHHHALELTRVMAVTVEYWPTVDATLPSAGVSRQEAANRYRHVRDTLYRKIKARFAIEGGPTV